jgi:hypothetical protein
LRSGRVASAASVLASTLLTAFVACGRSAPSTVPPQGSGRALQDLWGRRREDGEDYNDELEAPVAPQRPRRASARATSAAAWFAVVPAKNTMTPGDLSVLRGR